MSEENLLLALRAALAVRHNDEHWRLKYLEAEGKRVNAVLKAEAHEKAWYSAKSEFGTATAKMREQVRTAEAEVVRLRQALELPEVDVALARTWCRICRTENRSDKRSREAHPHEARCVLARQEKNS